MAIRNIRMENDEILRKKSKPINKSEDRGRINQLIEDMFDTIKVNDGIGLAAVQVGILKQLIVIEFEDKKYVLINPEILETEGEQLCEEGCLSFPNQFYNIKRPERVKFKYLDQNFEEHVLNVTGLLAVVVSHETDHLSGTLFIDKVVKE